MSAIEEIELAVALDTADKAPGAAGVLRFWAALGPRAVAIPYWSDRHPDHVAASRTLTEALFDSGLRRFEAAGDAWRPEWVCYYFINDSVPPSFIVDVSAHYEVKRRALACHRSQFTTAAAGAIGTRLTSPNFNQLIESRDAQFGALAGFPFAEGFVVREPLVRDTVFKTASSFQLPATSLNAER